MDLYTWSRLLAAAAVEPAAAPDHILALCVEHLDVSGAGMSVAGHDGGTVFTTATDTISRRIEDLQWTLGEGPCVDALSQGMPVIVSDLSNDPDLATERWPTFLAEASSLGVQAVFAFPMQIGVIKLGVLDLYRLIPGPLAPESLAAALVAADAGSTALLELRGGVAEADGVFVLPFQVQVHQATGMVQVQLRVTAADALLRLRSRAFVEGRGLIDVAVDVVERRLRFSEEDA